MLGLDRLELDGDLFTGDDVDPKVDVTCCLLGTRGQVGGACQPYSSRRKGLARTERTGANLFAQPVLSADTKVESMGRSVGHWMQVRSGRGEVSAIEVMKTEERKAEKEQG